MDVVMVMDELSVRFFNRIQNMDDLEYLVSIIKYHGAPTIAGIKPSSLVNFDRGGRGLYGLWEKHKDVIIDRIEIKYFEIINRGDRALVLFYNPDQLERVLLQPENMCCLRKFGYSRHMDLDGFLDFLRSRFALSFPHEIGIFLGIPVEDVEGFMENSGRGFIMNGYWKVYNSPERSMEMFGKYDRARIEVISDIMDKSV